jgi:CHAT domain-containing protein/Tfp pilus assembly protein PilF
VTVKVHIRTAGRGSGSGSLTCCLLLVLAALPTAAQTRDASDATPLSQEANRLYDAGRYAESARVAEQVLTTRQQALGAEHPDTVQAMVDLSRAYRGAGEYAKALPLAQNAVELREHAAIRSDPDTARALHNLAELYRSMGLYNTGLPPAQRGLDLREKALGATNPETAESLHSVAELYRSLGDYAKARPLAERALAIRVKVFGENHRDTAESRSDLGLLYFELRDDSRALDLYTQALRVREQLLGPDHPLTAETVNNLAALHWRQKDLQEALSLFERAVKSKEQFLGPDHPDVASALNNLAEVHRAMGNSGKAIPLLQRALAIWEKSLGPDHPNTAKAVNNLANFYWSMGNYGQARPLFERAEAISEKTLGGNHPDTARALNLLAAFSTSTGDYAQALEYYRRGLSAEDHVLANVFTTTSEEQKLEFVDGTRWHYLAALSLINAHLRRDKSAVRFGLELVLHRKGIILDVTSREREAVVGHLSGETLQAWKRLTNARKELQDLLLGGPGESSSPAYRQAIATLEQSIETEERFLSAHSPIVAEELAQQQVTAEQVAARLPPQSALVEFVHIRDWDEKRVAWTNTYRYLAFVLTPDNDVTLVDLGDAAEADANVSRARAAITDPNFLRDITAYTRKTDTELSSLYQRLLEPAAQAIGGSGRLIVSPDGALNNVPFAALRTPDGTYLIEKRAVAYVASGRDLARHRLKAPATLTMLMAANPAFDERGALKAGRFRSRPVRSRDYGKFEYPPLPGTAEEAKDIPPLVSGTKRILMGKDATESAVKTTKSPQILHLATHGFFLPDRPDDQSPPDPMGRSRGHQFRGGSDDDALARSGLALAGANHALEITDGDDGLLTAAEVMDSMDLYGTDLVVLSACETALGDIQTGEGVFGLRRAFVLAGTRDLIMSLWSVSDQITRTLMEHFYESYERGEPVADALRTAQVQTIAFLREKTSAGRQGEAFAPVNLWAPFIVQQTGNN